MTDTKDNKKVEEVLDDKNLDNVTGGTNQPSPNDRKKNPSDNKPNSIFPIPLPI